MFDEGGYNEIHITDKFEYLNIIIIIIIIFI
jgi:hypothetical protein